MTKPWPAAQPAGRAKGRRVHGAPPRSLSDSRMLQLARRLLHDALLDEPRERVDGPARARRRASGTHAWQATSAATRAGFQNARRGGTRSGTAPSLDRARLAGCLVAGRGALVL